MRNNTNDTQEHILVEEEKMIAARAKHHQEKKHAGARTEKNRKIRRQSVRARKSYSRRR